MYGALSGLRLGVAILACAFVVLRADPDLLTGLASRVAPRSALLVALAARLVPTMRRDAVSLSDAARARGLVLRSGPRKARVGAASTLVAPLPGERARARARDGRGDDRARVRRRTADAASGRRERAGPNACSGCRRSDSSPPRRSCWSGFRRSSAIPCSGARPIPARSRSRRSASACCVFALGVVERCSPS